jgi:hypothetical protein
MENINYTDLTSGFLISNIRSYYFNYTDGNSCKTLEFNYIGGGNSKTFKIKIVNVEYVTSKLISCLNSAVGNDNVFINFLEKDGYVYDVFSTENKNVKKKKK